MAQWRLGMDNGTLFAAPIPDEYAAQGAEIQAAVDLAIRESEVNGMSKSGKDATPWLLRRVVELTNGKSLESSELRSLVVRVCYLPLACSPFHQILLCSKMRLQ